MENWSYITLLIGGKTPFITGLRAHHFKQKKSFLYNSSKFGGTLLVFFPYRISETLVGKKPERFPSWGKLQFFFWFKETKGWAPKKNSVESEGAKLLAPDLLALHTPFGRFDRW